MTLVFLHRALPGIAISLLAACAGMHGEETPAPEAAPVEETGAMPAAEAPPPAASTAQPPAAEAPAAVRLSPSAPERYTVVKGDTLWDIAGKFLQDPWFWPEIWQVNPQIENPHLIYPGDVISLVYVDGRPQLRLERGGEVAALPPGTPVDRLSPHVRVEPLGQAITTIPYDAIAPFLSRPTVLSKDQVKLAPYILAMRNQHLVAGRGQSVYARSVESLRNAEELPNGASYAVYHIGDPYRDPDNNDVIGYEALYVGQGQIVHAGDPAKLLLTDSTREVLAGDRLLPVETDTPLNFYPSAPSAEVEGRIVAVLDGVSRIGQYNIVVLNRGAAAGLAEGHVLEVYQAGDVVRDHYTTEHWPGIRNVQLPEEHAGLVMVFRVLDDISYALVTEATNEIKVADVVRNP
jgi:hypothetical protein